jgi:hypothetical protein
MGWFVIFLIIFVIIIAAIKHGTADTTNSISTKSAQSSGSRKVMSEALLELINKMVSIGVEGLVSTKMSFSEKHDIVQQSLTSIKTHTSEYGYGKPYFYYNEMVTRAYETLLYGEEYEYYGEEVKQKIHQEYETFLKETTANLVAKNYPWDSIINYSVGYREYLQEDINKIEAEIKRRSSTGGRTVTVSANSYDNLDGTIKFEIVGIKYLPPESIERIKQLSINEQVCLVLEPENKYDSHAILVVSREGMNLGYVPQSALDRVHDIIASGVNYFCKVTRRTEHEIPYLWVLLVAEDYNNYEQ